MGLLDMFTGKANAEDSIEEQLRLTARNLLQQIVVLENRIERYEEALRNAEKQGNDPRQIRVDITNAEIKKLDVERALEQIDKRIVEEEKRKIRRM